MGINYLNQIQKKLPQVIEAFVDITVGCLETHQVMLDDVGPLYVALHQVDFSIEYVDDTNKLRFSNLDSRQEAEEYLYLLRTTRWMESLVDYILENRMRTNLVTLKNEQFYVYNNILNSISDYIDWIVRILLSTGYITEYRIYKELRDIYCEHNIVW